MNQVVAPSRAAGTARLQGELWGVRAGDWAEMQESVFRPLYQHVLHHPELAQASSSLDVGCGAGLAAQLFSGKIGAVAGIDACSSFVELARQRVPGGDFRVGEMEVLPYADESFDVVIGFNAFQYAASPVNALREARRVTKPGRHVVVATWGPYENCESSGHLKALAAHDTKVPFYVALPSPTIDFTVKDGLAEIPIEQRAADEVATMTGKTVDGRIETVQIVPDGSPVANYAFDVTPARLVTGLITERGIVAANCAALAQAFPERAEVRPKSHRKVS